MKNVIIIGGGLAGLISSIQLSRKGIAVTLLERNNFPFHRVCGEYVSNEVVPFLKRERLFPESLGPTSISRFQLTAVNGKSAILPLDLGGFGISRYSFDNFLVEQAQQCGVKIIQGTEATKIDFNGYEFIIQTRDHQWSADVVIAAHGKRSRLDIEWKREFTSKRSPYVGIKHHLKTNHPADLIALHNFEGGYCGISNVENDTTNLCYLVHRDKLRTEGSIQSLEQNVLSRNPWLKKIFNESQFLFNSPETINEISFETKEPVFNHMLMVGDAAGMITPLCGNGMSMAIRSGKLAADLVAEYCFGKLSRAALEETYERQWRKTFSNQLWFGRQVQRLFGSEMASNIAIQLAIQTKWIAKAIIRNTHGKPF